MTLQEQFTVADRLGAAERTIALLIETGERQGIDCIRSRAILDGLCIAPRQADDALVMAYLWDPEPGDLDGA